MVARMSDISFFDGIITLGDYVYKLRWQQAKGNATEIWGGGIIPSLSPRPPVELPSPATFVLGVLKL